VRRLLLIASISALLVGCFAGAASARLGGGDDPARVRAPFHAPAAVPVADAAQPGSYGYRSSDDIARELERAAGAPAPAAPATGASASIRVTATVLPIVLVVVDADGAPTELITNTSDRDPRGVRYLFRRGSDHGAAVRLTAPIWSATRAALARAQAGTGSVWTD
jgi:hypothetical protein